MFPFDKQYLKVLTPLTINGTTPRIGDDGRIEYKETYAPLTAQKYLERNNKKLPRELQKKIEVVNGELNDDQKEVIQKKRPSALKAKKDEDIEL